MKLLSLFDGSGGFPLAAAMCGIKPTYASEVEPYPIAVTRSRFPNMKHLGSVTDVKGSELEPVDIITFGSPCQDLSVAGKRAGLKHEENGDDETTRSGLFMEAIRIIKEMREATNGIYPRIAVWENVPGAFSSNKGEDFRTVLEEFIKITEPNAAMPEVPKSGWPYFDSYHGDGWSIAYRTFDAQHWGVPQRRRRIYLVADFTGGCAGEILFKREGLRGYFAEGRTPWQGIATYAQGSTRADDREGAGQVIAFAQNQRDEVRDLEGKAGALQAEPGMKQQTFVCEPITFEPGILKREGGHIYEGKAGTLRANAGDNQLAVAYGADLYNGNLTGDTAASLNANTGCSANHCGPSVICMATQQGGAEIRTDDKAPTVTAAAGMSGNNQPVICLIDSIGGQAERGWEGDIAPCLKATHYKSPPSIAYKCYDARGNGDGDTANTLTGDHNNRITDYTVLVCEPVAYNGENITSPLNKTNPQPGEPCHTLGTDSRNYVVCCYDLGEARLRTPCEYIEKCPTLTARCGTGGNNVPGVVCCIDGDKIGKAERSGGAGLGIRPGDKMYTLTVKDAGSHAVCIPIADHATRYAGNRNGKQDGRCNGLGVGNDGDPMNTLTAGDRHAVVYALDRACFNQGINAKYDIAITDNGINPPLVARGPSALAYCIGNGQANQTDLQEKVGALNCMHDQQAIVAKEPSTAQIFYIVRRLTPTECARLQGFPDYWGHPDHKDDLTDEEYKFWLDVRNTHAAINGKQVKEYTKPQILTWYNKLHTDSSEYKMWGNGIALPNALYIMQGIADALQ